ncbi:hypothetical protein VP01_2239g1 [Puccinia sorghi]|uniref:Uncharacterized protein n=1 Tax=Puccinia sorghi TaxID=27349 RepID=A0A0L6V8H0_9BASI|nr:hypothetical protein VP01_2239g1 [Puccinia sorghi]
MRETRKKQNSPKKVSNKKSNSQPTARPPLIQQKGPRCLIEFHRWLGEQNPTTPTDGSAYAWRTYFTTRAYHPNIFFAKDPTKTAPSALVKISASWSFPEIHLSQSAPFLSSVFVAIFMAARLSHSITMDLVFLHLPSHHMMCLCCINLSPHYGGRSACFPHTLQPVVLCQEACLVLNLVIQNSVLRRSTIIAILSPFFWPGDTYNILIRSSQSSHQSGKNEEKKVNEGSRDEREMMNSNRRVTSECCGGKLDQAKGLDCGGRGLRGDVDAGIRNQWQSVRVQGFSGEECIADISSQVTLQNIQGSFVVQILSDLIQGHPIILLVTGQSNDSTCNSHKFTYKGGPLYSADFAGRSNR